VLCTCSVRWEAPSSNPLSAAHESKNTTNKCTDRELRTPSSQTFAIGFRPHLWGGYVAARRIWCGCWACAGLCCWACAGAAAYTGTCGGLAGTTTCTGRTAAGRCAAGSWYCCCGAYCAAYVPVALPHQQSPSGCCPRQTGLGSSHIGFIVAQSKRFTKFTGK